MFTLVGGRITIAGPGVVPIDEGWIVAPRASPGRHPVIAFPAGPDSQARLPADGCGMGQLVDPWPGLHASACGFRIVGSSSRG